MSSDEDEKLAVVARPEGLYVPALDLFLDPGAAVPRAFLSHAHGDHVPRAEAAQVLASADTAALLWARFGLDTSHALAWGEPFAWEAPIGPCTLAVVPAGHVLGAAQLVAETPAGRLVYTGDYQSGGGLTHATGAPVACDVLVVEATFGLPIFRFPPRESVRAEIVAWCEQRLAAGELPVLLAYALGKAQELCAALGQAGVPVIAHGAVAKMCAAYEALGVALPNVRPYSAGDSAPGVFVVPPWARGNAFVKKRKNARIAYVSGWARIDAARERFDADAVFTLSDHADFDDLLFTVRSSGARRVYTTFGHAAPFAALLRELGIDARPLEALGRDAREQEPREADSEAREQAPREVESEAVSRDAREQALREVESEALSRDSREQAPREAEA